MARLKVKGWDGFQHYKDRAPPWIKLHKSLLDNYEFQRLPVASRALAPMIWLLASESADGSVEADIDKLAFRLRQDPIEVAEGVRALIQNGFLVADSSVLAECLQDACLETETETETEKEVSVEAKASTSSPKATRQPSVPCPYEAIFDAYEELLPDLPRIQLRDDEKRHKAMRTRWAWVLKSKRRDGTRRAQNGDEAMAWFREFFRRAGQNDWLMGRAPSRSHPNWRADLDFLLTDRGLKAVVERTEAAA